MLHTDSTLFGFDLLGLLAAELAPLSQRVFVRLVHDAASDPVGLICCFQLELIDELEAERVVRSLVAIGADVGHQVGQTISGGHHHSLELNSWF
ncbi:hypothetical protein D3C84_816420 [compost metagenome]